MSHLLETLGAEVHGLSIDIPTSRSLFETSHVAAKLASDNRGDICSEAVVESVFNAVQPDVVFHLAAQSLVLKGYEDPAGTFKTNVLGTLNVLEAIRTRACVKSAVVVTTDKVYKNLEWIFPYREIDSLGGSDPYSASKAAAEMIVAGYQSSTRENGAPITVSARAGNVIGGGDWSPGRLLPDLVRAINTLGMLDVRNLEATRPWQHVLDPLTGYLLLAEAVYENQSTNLPVSWNFGPAISSVQSVNTVIRSVEQLTGVTIELNLLDENIPKEHNLLALDSTQAHQMLSWIPKLDFQDSIKWTLNWYKELATESDMRRFTEQQIEEYLEVRSIK
jgi:CDP-glucose 4,6-dehydratase